MKTEELRIGNLVAIDDQLRKELFNCDEIIFKENVHDIAMIDRLFLNINIEGMEVEVTISDIEPIPLTEEWLLKMGFEKSNDLDSFYHLRIINDWTYIYYNPKHEVCELSISLHGSVVKVKSVNQLQNLFYCLTGTELTIKE